MKRKLNECGCGCGAAKGNCQDSREGSMAKHDAMECAEDAQDVANMIEESDNLPEWLEAKITLAADYMNKVKDYMTHYVRGTEPAPSYNKLPVRGDDFKPAYPMIIQTQDEMKDLMKEIIRKVDEKKWALYSKKKGTDAVND
jgi:hypothetical protein